MIAVGWAAYRTKGSAGPFVPKACYTGRANARCVERSAKDWRFAVVPGTWGSNETVDRGRLYTARSGRGWAVQYFLDGSSPCNQVGHHRVSIVQWLVFVLLLLVAASFTAGSIRGHSAGDPPTYGMVHSTILIWGLLAWAMHYAAFNKLHLLWLAPLTFYLASYLSAQLAPRGIAQVRGLQFLALALTAVCATLTGIL